MKRRGFFGVLAGGVAAGTYSVALGIETVAPRVGRRVSCVKGDPGERLYGEACADEKTVTVFLDGVEQRDALTADEAEGFVDRNIISPGGRVAFNPATREILHERVFGRVEIRIS